MTLSPEVLAAAMQKVSRDIYWRPEPWMYSTLRASAPPQPRSVSDTDIVSTPPRSAPVAADGHVVAPVGATTCLRLLMPRGISRRGRHY